MSSDWYLMSRPLFNSGFESDEFSQFAQDGFEEVLESFIAQDVEIYEKRISAKPIITRAVIQNVTSDTYNNSAQRQILCSIGTLRCGQYVKSNDGRLWLVSALPGNNGMYEKAILWQCKYTLRFLSPVTNEVVEYPVYDINSTQYGSGETAKTHMRIGAAQHMVYLPYNEETVRIDCGARFLIDKNRENPTAYRLTQVDAESYSCGDADGLLQWSLVESQRDDKTDNKELMVADYYGKSPISVPDEPETGYTISMTPENHIAQVVFGEELAIELVFSKDGKRTEPFPIDIRITDGGEYGLIEGVERERFVVRALKNRDYIGQEITVAAENNELGASASLILTIKGWY